MSAPVMRGSYSRFTQRNTPCSIEFDRRYQITRIANLLADARLRRTRKRQLKCAEIHQINIIILIQIRAAAIAGRLNTRTRKTKLKSAEIDKINIPVCIAITRHRISPVQQCRHRTVSRSDHSDVRHNQIGIANPSRWKRTRQSEVKTHIIPDSQSDRIVP